MWVKITLNSFKIHFVIEKTFAFNAYFGRRCRQRTTDEYPFLKALILNVLVLATSFYLNFMNEKQIHGDIYNFCIQPSSVTLSVTMCNLSDS